MCLLKMSDYPCRVCKEEVDVDDKGIQCEGECQYWYHCACLGINDGEYDCLAASDSKWECSKCSSADLPVLNSVDAVDVFHFDFQKNLPTPKLTGETILFEAVVDLCFWNLLSIYERYDGLYVA